LKSHFLNLPYFIVRAVIYFGIWFLMITLLNRWSAIQDRPYDTWLGRKFNIVSSAGMVIYFWTMTFATIDWLMSITPGWPSTMFPLIVIVGQGLLGMSLAIILGRVVVQYEPMNSLMDEVVFWDNGKLLLTFVMLWAYLSFSQWLIIWAGNLPEEIHWYLDRIRGGWGAVALFLVIFHFVVPFIILLSQSLKKDPRKLALVRMDDFYARGGFDLGVSAVFQPRARETGSLDVRGSSSFHGWTLADVVPWQLREASGDRVVRPAPGGYLRRET